MQVNGGTLTCTKILLERKNRVDTPFSIRIFIQESARLKFPNIRNNLGITLRLKLSDTNFVYRYVKYSIALIASFVVYQPVYFLSNAMFCISALEKPILMKMQ